MNEAQTRHDLIDPALHEAGWNTLPARIATELQVAPGRVESDGCSHKPQKADYVLMYGSRRVAVAVRNATKSPELLCKCWADMEKRHDFIETLEVVGFNPDKLREIQRNTGNLACDILDVMLDIAYDVEPVTREFRAQKAKVKLVGLPKERESLLGVMLANYVRDGVWTLTAESFMDLLRQRYGSLVGAFSKLDFTTPRDALLFYGRIQKEIYAA